MGGSTQPKPLLSKAPLQFPALPHRLVLGHRSGLAAPGAVALRI